MTKNKYWIYLEQLRRSGETNMYGASPYLQREFGLSKKQAISILVEWMNNYRREDYENED
jgi:hypothetical protein